MKACRPPDRNGPNTSVDRMTSTRSTNTRTGRSKSAGRASKPAVAGIAPEPSGPAAADLGDRIAMSAYYRAQARGFAPGAELDDWLAAEREILTQEMTTGL